MAGAIEGTVERTLNGEETTWEQLEFDFALSALTGGVLDGVGRKVTSKLAERATKKAAKELAEKTAKEATEKATKELADKATKELADKAAKETAEKLAKVVKVNGKNVIQNDDLFDPKFVDSKGRTNLQRMEKGLAPIGKDGQSVNLHHVDQTNNGDIMEITQTEHQVRYKELHTNTGQSPSQIDRPVFNKWRNDYWKGRKNDFNSE